MAEFKKVLSYRVLLLIIINTIIGSGVFFLPAIGARYAGPASILSWIILSGIAIYTAMIFSEMVSMYPKAGGIYEFCKHAYGTFFSFMVGWIAWIVGNVTTAMLIVGAVQYLLPYESTMFLLIKIGLSLFWVFFFNFMAYRGMRTSSFMLVTFAVITITIIIALLIPGFFKAEPANLFPFFIHDSVMTNVSAILLSIFFVYEAFFGLESVMFLAEETKEPERVLPKALVHATLIVSVLTILLVTVALAVMPYAQFGSSHAPFATLAHHLQGSIFAQIIALGSYLVILGAAAGWVVAGPRLIVSLTRDKLFPPKFAKLHPIHNSPYNAIIFQALISGVLVIIGFSNKGHETLLALLVPLVLIMMSASILALVLLRYHKPHIQRPYRTPLPYAGPILLVLLNLALIITWLFKEPYADNVLQLGFSTILLGVPIYFFLQFQYNPESATRVHDALAYITLLTERMLVPRNVRKKILHYLGDVQGKTIFEYGCSVGTLTLHLAEEVGPYGRIYATDFSAKSLNINNVRNLQQGHSHVATLHDKYHPHRVHPDVPEIDTVASVAVLGNIQKIDTVLSDMNRRLKVGSRICFVEYDKFFHIISNINWLANDSMIKHIFRRNGFLVNVKRERNVLWQTVYIYGKKVMDTRHVTSQERIDVAAIFEDLETYKGLHNFFKERFLEFRERITEQESGLIFYDDPAMDQKHFCLNPTYFGRMISTLLDSALYFSPPKSEVICKAWLEGDSLHLHLIAPIEKRVMLLFTNEENYKEDELDHIWREHLSDMHYARRLVSLAYKGEFDVSELHSDHDPQEHKHLRQFIIGLYEERYIEKSEEFLRIRVTIPLTSILEEHVLRKQ